MKHSIALTPWRVSLLTTLGLVVLYLLTAHSPLLQNLEARLLDMRFQWRGVQPPAVPVVVVVIDDKSIAELGRWPWSRSKFAAVVRWLHSAGARVIAFDMLFSEAEAQPVQEALQAIRTRFESLGLPSHHAALQDLYQTLVTHTAIEAPDQEFATAIHAAGNVVLAFSGHVTSSSSQLLPAATPPPVFLRQAAYRTFRQPVELLSSLPLLATALSMPIDPLGQAARALGHVTIAFDTDGTPRYDYPILSYQEAYYPSFALQVARLYRGLAPEEMAIDLAHGVQLGALSLPTDETLRFLVNYYGPPGTFPTHSFVDVAQDRVSPEEFRDQIVLIGAVASGLGDTFVTPFSPALSGVERHATLIANALRGDGLQGRQATAWLDLGCMLSLGLVLGWLSQRLSWRWGAVLALGLAGGYTAANVLAFTQARLWVNLLFPLLTLGTNYTTITLYKLGTEERQKRLLRRAFQHYLHPAVVARVAQHPERLTLGGEQRELTVLFSDIRGFSTFSEGLAPEVLVQLLNEYLGAMTRLVLKEQGMLDKYVGDAVMAVYGAPDTTPEPAYRACRTALRMLSTLPTLQARWQQRGLPVIDIGIGINTGTMVVGNMGSSDHLEYTVIGDAVNLGSRLEGANKEYGTHIIISEATGMQVQDRIATRELDVIRVKGKEKPTRIFEVLGFLPLPPVLAEMLRHFEAGLQAYRAQHWITAKRCFQQALHYVPSDPPSQLYIQRCEAYSTTPPPADWDGIYSMDTK